MDLRKQRGGSEASKTQFWTGFECVENACPERIEPFCYLNYRSGSVVELEAN